MLPEFDSPRALIVRAKEHLAELDRRITDYIGPQNFKHRSFFDRHLGITIQQIEVQRPIPLDVSVVAFDVASTLRSALDHAVYASAGAMGFSDPEMTRFPIAETPAKLSFEADRRPPCHPASEIREFLVSLGAHEEYGEHYEIWVLNKLRNVKTHRNLLSMRIRVHELALRRAIFSGATPEICEEWSSDGTTLTYAKIAGDSRYDLEFSPVLTLNTTLLPSALSAQRAFRVFGGKVERIVSMLEGETEILLSQRSSPIT